MSDYLYKLSCTPIIIEATYPDYAQNSLELANQAKIGSGFNGKSQVTGIESYQMNSQ